MSVHKNSQKSQAEKANDFKQLHLSNKLLILPNIWDVLGARLLESIGYKAIATASASVAFSNGYYDGENIPFHSVLNNLKSICDNVSLPVTADIECAYASNKNELKENIRLIINTGVVGINFEDTDKQSQQLNDISYQCELIKIIRSVAIEMGVNLFINARTDVMLHSSLFSNLEAQQVELVKRGKEYINAGADCFFPVALKNETMITQLVSSINVPINILAIPGIPPFNVLEKIGVARVSLGPGFLKTAIKSMKDLAEDLLQQNGYDKIMGNTITTDYLKTLIKS
ncbi:MAG: isocitrate lyase/phosphoenolpyruvate mutase family protein [Bacteroidetes bacterium]|nr:isocitrate lyase/phosphoenolpyruvate mutase family protein [Bacteroidota bacterium]